MLNRLQDVFRCFERHELRYVVIGGIASILHGVPRATFDLDVLIDANQENAEKLLASLLEAGIGAASLTTPADLLANEFTVFKDRMRIDVQTSTPGLTFEKAWSGRQIMTYQGQHFNVVSKAHLIDSKRAAGRPVDMENVRLQGGIERSRKRRCRTTPALSLRGSEIRVCRRLFPPAVRTRSCTRCARAG